MTQFLFDSGVFLPGMSPLGGGNAPGPPRVTFISLSLLSEGSREAQLGVTPPAILHLWPPVTCDKEGHPGRCQPLSRHHLHVGLGVLLPWQEPRERQEPGASSGSRICPSCGAQHRRLHHGEGTQTPLRRRKCCVSSGNWIFHGFAPSLSRSGGDKGPCTLGSVADIPHPALLNVQLLAALFLTLSGIFYFFFPQLSLLRLLWPPQQAAPGRQEPVPAGICCRCRAGRGRGGGTGPAGPRATKGA